MLYPFFQVDRQKGCKGWWTSSRVKTLLKNVDLDSSFVGGVELQDPGSEEVGAEQVPRGRKNRRSFA